MKIILISNTTLDNSLGSGFVINHTIKAFEKSRHQVEAFEPLDYNFLRFMPKAKQQCLAFSMLLLTMKIYFFKKIDVLVFFGAESWLSVLLLKFLLKKFMIVNHSNGLETNYLEKMNEYTGSVSVSGNKLKWYQINPVKLFHNAFKYSDFLVLNNKSDYGYALSHQYANGKTENIIYTDLGIDKVFLKQGNINLDRPNTITFCGSWINRKGIELIRSDVSNFLQKNKNVKLILIGVRDGFNLKKEFSVHLHKQIEVVTFLKRKEDLRIYLLKTKIFIFPSFHESFGLSLAEAMACGCACIVNDTGYASKFKHGHEVFKLGNLLSPSLEESLDYLFQNEIKRKKIASKAYKAAQNLNWEKVYSTINDFYKSKFYVSVIL